VPTQQTDGPGTSGLTDARKDSVDCTAVDEGSPASSDRPLKKSPSTNGGEPSGGSSAEAEGSTTNDKVDADDAEGADKAKTTKEPIPPFHDDELLRDLQNTETEQSTNIHGFFATLALCHTALASRGENGVWNYMAQSPDESALCVMVLSVFCCAPVC
jgi:magnesium-transporting ATPase (P-type)